MPQGDISKLYIYHDANEWPNKVMDIRQIRLTNMERLISEFGTLADVARRADTDPSYLSQIRSKKTKRQIGDDLARRLERAAGKAHGWMDHDHAKSATPPATQGGAYTRHEEAIIEIYRQLPPGVRKRFLDIVYAFASACGVRVKHVA